jgi:peptidoglycan hydrolase-like protein with peptidoglycan-binding domain
VTHQLNGGFVGLPERTAWLGRWKTMFSGQDAAPHSATWVQVSLNKLGADPALIPDGSFGSKSAAVLKKFQAAHGLVADGTINPATLAAIDAALAAA